MRKVNIKDAIRLLVRTGIETYAQGFQARHEAEVDDPEGTINMKIHNVFIEALGEEIQYYTALVRSLDSSLGTALEKLAINIARLTFEVKQDVEGPLAPEQTSMIADLLESYKSRQRKPAVEDYQVLRAPKYKSSGLLKRHDSDYYLIDKNTNNHYLIELKIGGDLDNKKARSENEAILEQFAILSNVLPPATDIRIFFATAYNRFGENKYWGQERVRQFFANEELLIGKDFWNFICRSDDGYDVVLKAYRDNAYLITDALKAIKKVYLG